MRKLLSVLFSTLQGGVRGGLLFLALLSSVSAIYASYTQVDGIWYNFDNSTKTASVTYRGSNYNSFSNEYSGSVIIPETVTYDGTTYSVTSIGGLAFYDCSSLTSVIIGESVTSIGGLAFYGCTSLTSVTIGKSVTSIGESAFYSCSKLTKTNYTGDIAGWCNIKFGDSSANPMCYSHNFYINDQEIKDLVIPNSVTSIGDFAFYDCSSLTSVIIGESVTSIGSHAFYGCTSLTSVTIPNSVTSIGNGAFSDCSSLTSVTIGESVTSIGERAFAECSSLTSITIPNSVTSIGDNAFYSCSGLTSVTIPESVTSIGDWAFSGCSSLTSITIPESVINIGRNALLGTPWLENLPDGVVYINNVLYTYKGSMPSNTSIDIEEGIVSISPYAFYNYNNLRSITIPKDIKYIGESAFNECKNLKTVHIYSIVPPEITTPIFASKYIPTIYVLPDAFLAYLSSWSDYRDNIKTTGMEMTLDLLNRTQTTISIHASLGDLGDLTKSGGHGVQWSIGSSINPIKNYWGTITGYDCETIYFDEGMLNLDTTITNLSPNTQYAFRVFYRVTDGYNTEYIYGETKTFTTSSVVLSEPTLQTTGQTYIEVQTSSAYGDATLVDEVVEVATSKYNTPEQRVNVAGRSNVIINNLMPDTKYYFRSVLTTQEAGTMQSEWYEATTEEITLATGDADGISNSSAFLHGTIDCDTMSRTEIGFEWKRSDAPSTVKPQRLLVVDRVDEKLIFRLEGLSSDRYYDFRTFCLYNGKEYYGEWVGFLTSDKDILIPPSVQTREAEITDLGVLMKGFVVAGTEVILQRGFECWREESDQVATTVAEGAIMSSYIPEAWSYTTYKYRAYAKTPAGTTYGETLEVTTEYIATNIADIIVNASSNSAQVTWTMVEQADYYILTLYSDESMTEVIAVYTVDKNGNVTQKRVASATQSLVTCELTELLPETNYYFAVKAYNNNDQMVAEENGSFATTVVPTSVENTHTQSPMTNCQKIIRDNQLLILRDGKTYNVMGVIVE